MAPGTSLATAVGARRHAALIRRACACIAVLCLASPAAAQYFGQNKVQYETFDFQVLRTDNFDIYFYPEAQAGTGLASRMAERWNERLQKVFDHRLSSRQPLILYASSSHFQQTNVIGGRLGETTGGVTESARRRIVLPLAGALDATDHVIGHELVHAFQYDIAANVGAGTQGMQSLGRLPLWFIEGMAEYLSIGRRSPLTAMWMRDAVAREKLPTISDLDNPRYFPYRWGHAFWAYVAGRWGDAKVATLLEQAVRTGSPAAAFVDVLGVKEEDLTTEWHAALQRAYGGAGSSAPPANEFGRLLTPGNELGATLNVSPSLSPDGTQVAYLSSRGLFSIDIYVADAATGKIVRRLTSTDVDPHLSSLQFVESGGTWHPSGRLLAATVVSKGRPVLAVFDVNAGRREREIPLEGVQGAMNPTWSPDGKRIAFVGVTGGLTDLFVCDLETGSVTRLTDDPFTELHPAWSPQGERVAFVTDRFTTRLDTLSIGEFQLALIDVASQRVSQVAAFDHGDHRNPQWSADGGSLFFIAHPDGVSNVYRVDAGGGAVRRVTQARTGVSGITEASPALSVAGGRMAFTLFDDGGYRLYATDDEAVLHGRDLPPATTDAALLPPVPAVSDTVTRLLASPARSAPATTTPEVEPYHPSLSLEYVAQPTLTVGASQYGVVGGGGVAFVLGDMLGDHQLVTAVQSMSTFDGEFSVNDIGGGVQYTNLKHRWNWGVALDQSPYRSGGYAQGTAIVGGRPALIEQSVVYRQTNRGASGIASYAISRAQRVELSAGFRNISVEQRIRTTVFSLESGEILSDEREKFSPFPSLNLATGSAALVYDTSSFGATSPVLGQRYRFEVSPMFGTIRYTGVLADFRRYFMPVRLYTLAARVLHYGRYGADAESNRLSPLFLGYPSLVRGYDVGTFKAEECPPRPDGACPAFDRLAGSRVLVANLEFRFPLFRPFGLRERVYGPIPIEAAVFADAGVAWDSDDKPKLFGGDRQGVSSVGGALRVNALGFAVLQFDFSRPLQRRDRGWVFQFSMAPGF